MTQKIRQLKLYNSRNDLVDLVNERWIFGTNPDDMGAKFGNDTFQIGANTLLSKRRLETSTLKLDMYYGLEQITEYESFNKFVEFLNYTPYKLSYENDAVGEVFRDCILSEVTRPDISEDGMLIGSLSLDFLTPFYKEISETYKPNSDTEGDGKIYTGTNKPRNLIADPNFLNNMQDWANMSDPEGAYQLQAPATDKPTSNILKLTSSNNKLSSFRNAWGLLVKKGERISFRVDIKTENNPDYDRPVIRVGYGTGEKSYKYSDFGITSSSSGFKTATISFVVPEDGVFQLYLINQNWSTLGTMSTYFREPMLIRGEVSDIPVEQYDSSYPNLNLLNFKSGLKIGQFLAWADGLTIGPSPARAVFDYVSVIPGTTYTINSNWDKTERIAIYAYDSNDRKNANFIYDGGVAKWFSPSTAGRFVTQKTTLSIPDGMNFIRVVFLAKDTSATLTLQDMLDAKTKVEPGSNATPWMPSASEVKPSDYPSYMPGFYSGKPSNNYYVYPYVYESDYNGKSGVFQIENNSVYIGSAKGSPVEITVHGPCTNPYWEILDGSKVLQSDGYNIDVPDGYKLVVSSVVQKQRVKLIAPDGTISDVYQQQDLSRSNFVTIPEGHVTLAFHNIGDVSFNYREEYITV